MVQVRQSFILFSQFLGDLGNVDYRYNHGKVKQCNGNYKKKKHFGHTAVLLIFCAESSPACSSLMIIPPKLQISESKLFLKVQKTMQIKNLLLSFADL